MIKASDGNYRDTKKLNGREVKKISHVSWDLYRNMRSSKQAAVQGVMLGLASLAAILVY